MQRTWERLTERPLTFAAVCFLAAYGVPIIWPGQSPAVIALCRAVIGLTWTLFVVDLMVRVVLAERPGRYVARHWLDVLIMVLPLLRSLRMLRLVVLLRVFNRQAAKRLRGHVAVHIGAGAALIAFCGALAVLDAERGHGQANITSFGDALWWAITTMSTVGYGDHYPTTGEGRLAAAALVIAGTSVLGVLTATAASWLVDHVAAAEARQTRGLQREVADLHAKLDQLLAQTAPS